MDIQITLNNVSIETAQNLLAVLDEQMDAARNVALARRVQSDLVEAERLTYVAQSDAAFEVSAALRQIAVQIAEQVQA